MALGEGFEHETKDTVDEAESTEDDKTNFPVVRVQQPDQHTCIFLFSPNLCPTYTSVSGAIMKAVSYTHLRAHETDS